MMNSWYAVKAPSAGGSITLSDLGRSMQAIDDALDTVTAELRTLNERRDALLRSKALILLELNEYTKGEFYELRRMG